MVARALGVLRFLAPARRYAARPKRPFRPWPASLIIRASNPAPAITAKCSPFTEPVSNRRRSPCSPARTAWPRSAGICRLLASRLAVPAGSTARTAPVPATASMHRWTVPSPPQTKITSAPWVSALRARLGAWRLLLTSYHSGSAMPSPASISRSSPRPPPRLLPVWATTAIFGTPCHFPQDAAAIISRCTRRFVTWIVLLAALGVLAAPEPPDRAGVDVTEQRGWVEGPVDVGTADFVAAFPEGLPPRHDVQVVGVQQGAVHVEDDAAAALVRHRAPLGRRPTARRAPAGPPAAPVDCRPWR